MKSKKTATLELVKICCRVLDDKKAGELTVLNVAAQSSITDYLVLATATSEPHLRALRVELEKALDDTGAHIVGMETAHESGWLVVDAFDVMFHLFLAQTRERYGLDRLWRDATEISISKLLKEQTGAAPSKRSSRQPSARRPTRKKRPKK